jgi:5-methylcytosine-specific restriction endonuclease McrA
MNILREQVLVLNRLWQAVRVCDVEQALTDMVRRTMTPILVPRGPDDIEPMRTMTWEEWVAQPLMEDDKCIHTVHHKIRIPTVVALGSYDKIRKVSPKLTNDAIGKRDGYICQYSGRFVPNGNVDHPIPKARGGARKSWENMVWSDPEINTNKGSRLNSEAGLKLRRKPKAPLVMPAMVIVAPEDKPEWKRFLILHQ